MKELWQWIEHNEALLAGLGVGSVVMFVGSLMLLPVLIVRMPADYFAPDRPARGRFHDRHPALRMAWVVVRNAVGAVLLAAGIAMLVLPGQGLLTILVGLSLVSFPGKRDFERRLVARRPIRRSIDWIRSRAGRPPLRLEASDGGQPSE